MRREYLLLEIGMEECPARFVGPALAELARIGKEQLEGHRIAHGTVRTLGTPRRLALMVEGVAERQEDMVQEVKGPPARAAFDENGAPTRAAQGFAASQGVPVESLAVKEIDGGAYVFAVHRQPGKPVQEVLPELLANVVASLRFPKSMRWGDGTLRFARPIRWLVAMWGREVIPFELEGVVAGKTTRGHRVLADRAIPLPAAEAYVEVLREEGRVLVDVEERRSRILQQIETLAREIGGELMLDEVLLDEVTHLVEWPTALRGQFDPAYLEVPEEILVLTMKEHQRYFPVRDKALLPVFIAVRNGDETGIDIVRAGNEKVLSARLADARFFYTEDLKRPLSQRVEELKSVVFQERLGSLWDKTQRVRKIIERIGGGLPEADLEKADRAATLCKADLVTNVVYEFPELQGVMGREYALRSGEDASIAEAIFEHYLPRHASDELPKTLPGILVSLADKADTIVGCFGIGLVPTGSADPYALRRQALGIIRIQLAHRTPIRLRQLLEAAADGYTGVIEEPHEVVAQVLDFFAARMRHLLIEEGVRHDLVDAALALGVDDLIAAWQRAKALQEAAGTETFAALITAYQRAANLAKKASSEAVVDPKLFSDDEEAKLWDALRKVRPEVEAEAMAGRYEQALQILAGLRPRVDAFFDAVLVMAQDEAVRNNRLALLQEVVAAFGHVADLSLVKGRS